MDVCVINAKECWRDSEGRWFSNGGFPLQMHAIGSLFDKMSIVISESPPKAGGLPLPEYAAVRALKNPSCEGFRRKAYMLVHLFYYVNGMIQACKNADVVHVAPPGDFQLLGMLVALGLRKPLLARYCGSWSTTNQTTWMNRFTKWLMRKIAGGRNVILVTGEGARSPAPRASWIFATSLSLAELRKIRPDLNRGISNPPKLIYAGRLSPEKGVENLLQAISNLKQSGFSPLPVVRLAGDGPQRDLLERRTRDFGCEHLVEFRGHLNRDQLSKQFLEADLCVQPSLTEGYSKAWLDAMAHGLPVLASNVGAARHVIGPAGERGWLVPPGDPNALTETLRKIIENSPQNRWTALRKRCRSFVEKRTLEAWGQQIGEICAGQWGLNLNQGKLR